MGWGFRVWQFCFFLVFFSAKCGSSVSARVLICTAHAACFLPLVTILLACSILYFNQINSITYTFSIDLFPYFLTTSVHFVILSSHKDVMYFDIIHYYSFFLCHFLILPLDRPTVRLLPSLSFCICVYLYMIMFVLVFRFIF
jgi:hypothetical protein